MVGSTRIATLATVAALAMATGVAGATSKPGSVSGAGSHLTRAGKTTTSATTRAALLNAANLRTRAGAARYLRSIGLSSRHFVIQHGIRNYAGATCPGAGWSCTSTAHPVIQIAAAGGKNTFLCSSANCAVVQVAAAAAKPNKAACVRITGLGASCTISQSSASLNNVAAVYEDAGKATGLTQTASYTASITQKATGTGNSNQACVHQVIAIDGSTNASGKKSSVSVGLEAHQSVTITQDSLGGGNSAQDDATSSGVCTANPTTNPLLQAQTVSSTVTASGPVTQNENLANSGANITLDIEQNQSSGFKGSASGANNAIFKQTNSLTAIANSPLSVSQTQSSVNGGILAKVNQDSSDVSTAKATQTENQCEDAATSGLTSCSTTEHTNMGPSSLTQTQFGPIRKDLGDSSQTGDPGDTFTVVQNSQQDNDTQSGQTNVVSGGFHTDGTGTVSQTTTVNGQTSSDTQGGSGDVSGSINCTGSSCTSTPPATLNVLIAGTGDFSDDVPTEPNDNLAQALTSAGYSVTESPALPLDLSGFSQVWWVDAIAPTQDEQNQLINFAQSGKGVFLTGERPCCEDLNSADQTIVNSVVVGGGITVGGQGDVCSCNTPLPVNLNVVGNLATQPHAITSWQPAAPGGMANVPDSSVFSYFQPGNLSTRQVVAAAWDRSSTVGNGRLVVFMDINWPEAVYRAANWSDVAENVAFFLSGLSSPPSPPILQPADTVVAAGPSLLGAQVHATRARAITAESGSATSSTR